MKVVVKIGTSSLTSDDGRLALDAIDKAAQEVARAQHEQHSVAIVTSAAIGSGLPLLGLAVDRQRDSLTLRAAAAVGQSRLQHAWDQALERHGVLSAQLLLTPSDFYYRRQYLHARQTVEQLLQMNVVPVINENDATADEVSGLGGNDRLAALLAHSITADLLLLLTDTEGIYTNDPRIDQNASLIEEVLEFDEELNISLGGAGTSRGHGGMTTKLTAARMAAWSGVPAVIASAKRDNVLMDAINGAPGVGTVVLPRSQKLSARKLWIAFAMPAAGRVQIDDGARRALIEGNRSLLPAGVTGAIGEFDTDTGVEIIDAKGEVIAKGLSRYDASTLRKSMGRRTTELADGIPHEVVHRDDLVILI